MPPPTAASGPAATDCCIQPCCHRLLHRHRLLRRPEAPTCLEPILFLFAFFFRYTEDDVKTIMGRLLDAVAYMHLHSVTHRDLKLENLMLARPAAHLQTHV